MQEKVRVPYHGKIKAKLAKHSCSKSVFDTAVIMVINSRESGFAVPSYHQVTIQVTTKCNIFHSHTQESYHQVLPLTYHTSYNTSYHSIHAPFRVKVTSFHELPLNFKKKYMHYLFKYFYGNLW